MPILKKRRTDHELEEGEVAHWKENKQRKIAKDPRDKRGPSIDSRDEAELCQPQRTWAPRLEMEGATISYDASIWDVPKGHTNYLAQSLQQPLFLPRDMDSIWCTKQLALFMSLKRDLAMVSCSSSIQVFKNFFFFFYIFIIYYVDRIFNYTCYLHAGHSASLRGQGLATKCK